MACTGSVIHYRLPIKFGLLATFCDTVVMATRKYFIEHKNDEISNCNNPGKTTSNKADMPISNSSISHCRRGIWEYVLRMPQAQEENCAFRTILSAKGVILTITAQKMGNNVQSFHLHCCTAIFLFRADYFSVAGS